jgi:hypothetical protein
MYTIRKLHKKKLVTQKSLYLGTFYQIKMAFILIDNIP